MNKVLFIVGPTATGKTRLALNIVLKIKGSLVNCDSVQVYKGLNIISGKDIPQSTAFHNLNNKFTSLKKSYNFGFFLIDNIPLYLVDLVESTFHFSIADYIDTALPVIEYIESTERIPVVVGGTAFYVKALLDGVETIDIPQDESLRVELDGKSVEELVLLLKKEEISRLSKMNESDIKNKRRLVRAIEVARHKKISNFKFQISNFKKIENKDILTIGLYAKPEVLRERINKRVEERKKMGAVEEATRLFADYKNISPQVKSSSGYNELFEYCMGKVSLDDAIKNWKTAEYHVAKKQMTFFKKDKRIKWFDISKTSFENEVEEIIFDWCNKRS